MPERVAFTANDEACCHFDEPGAPNTVQFEVGVRGGLDPERLRDAVHGAIASHPRYGFRRLPRGRLARRYFWQGTDALDVEPFTTGAAKDADALALERAEFYGSTPSVDAAPALRIRHLVIPEEGDLILFCAHHALLDGRSLAELVRAVASLYSGAPLAARRSVPAPAPAPASGSAASTGLRRFARPLHLTRRGGGAAGYGFERIAVDACTLRPPELRGTATINDIVVTSAVLALARAERQRPPRHPVRITVPFSEPVAVPGNNSSLGNVEIPSGALAVGADLRTAVADVSTQISALRRDTERQLGAIGTVFASGVLPLAVKARLVRPAARWAGIWQSSAVVSNLGEIPELRFGASEDLAVDHVAFSAPARMPRGVFLGVAGHRGVVHLTLRYNTALFDAPAAVEFAGVLRRALSDVTESLLAGPPHQASG